MRRICFGVVAMAAMTFALAGCSGGGGRSGSPAGASCNDGQQCASGICLSITCQGSGAQKNVCGGAVCQQTCSTGNACVQVSGTNTAFCVPESVCGGGGGGTDCDRACEKIYTGCQLTLQDIDGNAMSQADCAQSCGNLGRTNMEACVNAANCDGTAVVSCFQ